MVPTSCDNVKIENLYITDDSDIYVETTGTESVLKCSATSNGEYLTLKIDKKNYKEMFSALLAARTTNQPMKIDIHSGSENCDIERVEYGKYCN